MYLNSQFQKHRRSGLLTINITNLKKLYQLCKGRSPKIVLTENGIDLINEDASVEEIRGFQAKILKLLQSANKKKAANKKKTSPKSKGKSSDKTEAQDNPRTYHRKGLLQLMEKDLRKPDGQLENFTPQVYARYLDLQKTLAKYIKARAPRSEED